ncbi:MAG: hypothetical protein Q9207_005486 [Kuettlingeria erythrocarpa]
MASSSSRFLNKSVSGPFLALVAWLVTLLRPIHCNQIPLKNLQTEAASSEAGKIVKKVAIIGSGPSGAATAYFLRKQSSSDLTYKIALFEKEAELGGRVSSIVVPGHDLDSVEVGVTAFSEQDAILNDIVDDVGLKQDIVSAYHPNKSAIWDGQHTTPRIPTRTITWRDWADMTRLYGLGFVQSMHLTKDTFSTLSRLHEAIPIHNIYRSMHQLDAADSLWWTPSAYLRSKWISGKFVDEYATASIRALFGQDKFDSNAYHLALALNSLIQAPLRLKGGNSKLIDGMIAASLAEVHHSRQVMEITNSSNDSVRVRSRSVSKEEPEEFETSFDSVIIAAPWASTGISLPDLTIQPATVEYTEMHVTHFLSPFDLNPQTFKLEIGDPFPDDIMSLPVKTPNPTGKPHIFDFFRLTKVQSLPAQKQRPDLNLYRLLTPQATTPAQLLSLLRIPKECAADPISWEHSHHWPFAYPKADYEQYPYFSEVADNIYITANIELIGSRLETAVTMGKNMAKLVDAQLREQIGAQKCQVESIELDE